jgi:Protein of unknown function (DUF2846)
MGDKMFKKLFLVAMLAVSALATGCASVQMASVDQDAKMKTFAPQTGVANIYVYRNEGVMGAAMKLGVTVDGKDVGETAGKTYFMISAAPGKHTIASKGESGSTVDINAEAGKNYFIWQEVKMGLLSAGSKLHIMDDAAGKAGVQECKLIASK